MRVAYRLLSVLSAVQSSGGGGTFDPSQYSTGGNSGESISVSPKVHFNSTSGTISELSGTYTGALNAFMRAQDFFENGVDGSVEWVPDGNDCQIGLDRSRYNIQGIVDGADWWDCLFRLEAGSYYRNGYATIGTYAAGDTLKIVRTAGVVSLQRKPSGGAFSTLYSYPTNYPKMMFLKYVFSEAGSVSLTPTGLSRVLPDIQGTTKVDGQYATERPGSTCRLGGVGNSNFRGWNAGGMNGSVLKYAADVLGWSFYSPGHPGWATFNPTLPDISEAASDDMKVLAPAYFAIEGGINDEDDCTEAQTLQALKDMVNMAVYSGSVAIFLPIWPYTGAGIDFSRRNDRVNADMIAWMAATHPGHLIFDVRPLIGQFRSGGDVGNYWDMNPAYTNEPAGLHPNAAGYQYIGEQLAAFITANA